jgi:hypothetical protein
VREFSHRTPSASHFSYTAAWQEDWFSPPRPCHSPPAWEVLKSPAASFASREVEVAPVHSWTRVCVQPQVHSDPASALRRLRTVSGHSSLSLVPYPMGGLAADTNNAFCCLLLRRQLIWLLGAVTTLTAYCLLSNAVRAHLRLSCLIPSAVRCLLSAYAVCCLLSAVCCLRTVAVRYRFVYCHAVAAWS